MYQRFILGLLKRRFRNTPITLITGPRQCGKTTISKLIATEEKMDYITCDHINTVASIQYDPIGFLNNHNKPLIIDEVQRVPEIFLPIKMDVDNNRIPGRYLLTGSANPLLIPKLGDSLVGRMGICNMWPLSQGEILGIQENFLEIAFGSVVEIRQYPTITLEQIIEKLIKGGFPTSLQAQSNGERKEWCNDYLFNILQKDINDLSKIDHFNHMPSLLIGLANRIGSPINYSALSEITRTSESTIRRYLQLLTNLFLIFSLPAWGRNADKKLSKAPKIYFSDTAMLLQSNDFDEERLLKMPNVLGQVFENFVVMELVKQISWHPSQIKIFHFRTHDKKEVDVVLEASGRIVGVEIKLSSTIRKEDLKGLIALQETAGSDFHKGIILYTGEEIIPFGDAFIAMPITALWSRN